MQIPTKASLIQEYLTYGLNLEQATECAEYELNHKILFMRLGSAYIKRLDAEAKDYNKRMAEQRQLSSSQLEYKKRGFEQRKNLKESGRKYNNARPVTDPNGVYYRTTGEMCKVWNISLSTYCKRRAKGWTMLEALTGK